MTFAIGFFAAVVAVLSAQQVMARMSSGKDKSNGVFYTSRPFLVAFGLSISFLALALLVENAFVDEESYTQFLFDPKTYVAVFKEFFFATVIALFIIATIEISSRKEQDDYFREAVELAQKNVFEAIYKNRLDADVLVEAEESIFKTDFIRTRHNRNIHLQPLEDTTDYVLLTSTQDFRVRNVTGNRKPYTPTVYLPKRPGNHADKVCVTLVRVFRTQSSHRSSAVLDVNSKESAEVYIVPDGNAPHEICYRFPQQVCEPGEEIEVHISLTLVKEKFDNEIWTTLIPTLRAEVSVQTDVEGLTLSAIALHRGSMDDGIQGAGSLRKWVVERPMLPYQGYVVSWSEAND